ncbi:MAG: hypothetical protein ACKO96_08595, partial [Flammeovirgaceae bacterium]
MKSTLITFVIVLFHLGLCFEQAQYKGIVKFRFTEEYEAHTVGYYGEGGDKPAFDPVPDNLNRDSIKLVISRELDKYPISVLKKSRLGEIVICDGAYFNDLE